MAAILYNIFVYPIEFLIEFFFAVSYRLLGSLGFAILAVSVLVNFLVLPMYLRADALQGEENRAQKRMARWVDHIKRTWRGDERYLMLSEYYRQNHYHPVYALRSSISLLLQIPFFIAAYHFLTHLALLEGSSFYFIRDLGEPDRLLFAGGLTVNFLPVLMTAINLIAGAIYLKDATKTAKIQLFALAFLFLILLYESPAGLVLYWTMNNVFSLAKNIIMKLFPAPQKAPAVSDPAGGSPDRLFVYGSIVMAILTGFLIPLSVIGSAPADFMQLSDPAANPMKLVWQTFCIAGGLFLLWGNVLYFLAKKRTRTVAQLGMWVAVCLALINCFAFGRSRGMVTDQLVYELADPDYPAAEMWINSGLLLLTAVVCVIVFCKLRGILPYAYGVILLTILVISGVDYVKTTAQIRHIYESREMPDHPLIRLSRSGHNVVVFMLDRAIGMRLPALLAERPALREQYDGFTFYPNTISFGPDTLLATPALFGGYEYTPARINERTEEALAVKHNEAMRVMPVLFADAGYDVVVCDPPYAGYTEPGDLSIYADYPKIEAHNIKGAFSRASGDQNAAFRALQQHNLLGYGINRILPLCIQPVYYDDGRYCGMTEQTGGMSGGIRDDLGTLLSLSDMTEIREDDGNHFLMIDNELSHNETILQLPDYQITAEPDNDAYLAEWEETLRPYLTLSSEKSMGSYMDQAAALLLIGSWLDHLREAGVYDNTRIILVSDHGYPFHERKDLKLPDGKYIEGFNPLLMVKDFDGEGFTISEDFMTNADVPALATADLLQEAVNPFTGEPIDQSDRKGEEQLVVNTSHWRPEDYSGTTFDAPDNRWYTVKDDLYDPDNWKLSE